MVELTGRAERREIVRLPGGSPFQRALADRRERYNALIGQTRIDRAALLTDLREVIGPVVDAAGGDPVALTDALLEFRLAVARWPDGYPAALRAVAGFAGREPRRVPVAIGNALHHVVAAPEGRPADWIATLSRLARSCPDVPTLLDAAAVAAWRCGVAQLRASALATAARLSPSLRGVALLMPGVDDGELARIAADPWYPRTPGLLRRVGAFRGFGGVFARPPLVSWADGGWYATDGDGCWRVYADRFGVAFRRVEAMPPPAVASASVALPELAEVTSSAVADGVLAATTPYTHAVLFVALP